MDTGVAPEALHEPDLLRELKHLHETRFDTLLHGGQDALDNHTDRMAALEEEYLRRHPERDIDPERTRLGARARGAAREG